MTPNTNRELSDAWIEQMLRTRAGVGTPADLTSAIAAQTAATTQRPGSIGRRLTQRRGKGALLLVAAVLAGGAIVGATIVGNRNLSVPERRPLASTAVATPLPSAVSAPSGVPSLAPVVTRPHDFSNEQSFLPFLVTDAVGWVATANALYRTTDGGRTWAETQPRHAGPFKGQVMVDADAALVVAGEGIATTIISTHDGGATWTAASIDIDPGQFAPLLLFRSSQEGTVSFYDLEDRSRASLRVYHTTDGGETWDGGTTTPLPMGAPKLAGWGDGVMWLNLGKADNKPFDNHLWLSKDGGATWKPRWFPTAPWAPAGDLKWVVGPPLVSDNGRIVLGIGTGDRNGLFVSVDDGQTWRPLDPAPAPSNPNGYATYHLTDSEWVFADGAAAPLLTTLDAGQHWRPIQGDRVNPSASFASPEHGWAYHSCHEMPVPFGPGGPDPFCDGNSRASVLLETTDGGQTWHPLGE